MPPALYASDVKLDPDAVARMLTCGRCVTAVSGPR